MTWSDPVCLIDGEINAEMQFKFISPDDLFDDIPLKQGALDSEEDEVPALHAMEDGALDSQQDEVPIFDAVEGDVVSSEQGEVLTLHAMGSIKGSFLGSTQVNLAGDFGVDASYLSEPIAS